MNGPPVQVVAVADHTGRQSRLVAALVAAFAAAGLGLVARTQRELAGEVSILQRPGSAPAVAPDRPLLWLCPADRTPSTAPDDRFLSAEAHSAARSIAMLTRAPVLNRPTAVGLCGSLPAGRPRAVRSSSRYDPGGGHRPEWFAGARHPDPAEPTEVWDYAHSRSSFGVDASAQGPFRFRPAAAAAAVVKVRVIGREAVCAAGTGAEVRAASCRIAAGHDLDMATLWWLVGPDGEERTLARIDGWTWDVDGDPDAGVVATAVAGWMGQQLAGAAR